MTKKYLAVAALAVLSFVSQAVELTAEEYQDFKYFQQLQWKQRLSDEKSSSTAVKWHGAIKSTETDIERMVTVYTYEDGWTLEVKAKNVRPAAKSPEEIAAARARKIAELAKRIPLEAAENIVKRDEPVETNEVFEVVTPQR